MREIITLQFGKTANFTGSHLWNIQEEAIRIEQEYNHGRQGSCEIDHTVLHRQTEYQGSLQHVPRVLVVDAIGSAGGNLLGDQSLPASVSTWTGGLAVHNSPHVPPSTFRQALHKTRENGNAQPSGIATPNLEQQDDDRFERLSTAARQLDDSTAVENWADFLSATLSPASIWQLPGILHRATNFSGYGVGQLHLSTELREDLGDRTRTSAEECDSIQGFQLLVDDMTGFGSIATHMVQHLQEDFPKTRMLAMPIRFSSSSQAQDRRLELLSQCLSLAEMCHSVSMYAPVAAPDSLPSASWRSDSLFHSSALCAAFLDSATLPTRLLPSHPGSLDIPSLASLLAGPSNFVCCAASLPCPDVVDERLAQPSQGPFTQRECRSWTPNTTYSGWAGSVQAETLVLRHAQGGGVPLLLGVATEYLRASLMREGHRAVRQWCVAHEALAVPLPFPLLFHSSVQTDGRGLENRGLETDVVSLPVLTRLAQSQAIDEMIGHSAENLKRLSSTAYGRNVLECWDYSQSEVQELVEGLRSMKRAEESSESSEE